MSGRDERKISIYPPECPSCHSNHEWFLGSRTWILTERSMKWRGLQYPVIAPATASLNRVSKRYVTCITRPGKKCHARFEFGTDIYKAVVNAFRANLGKPYNRSPLGGDISNVW